LVETEGTAEKRGKSALKRGGDQVVIDETEGQKKEKPKQDEKGPAPKAAGPKVRPFQVFVGEEAKAIAAEMGEKKGLIEGDVCEEGPEKEGEMLISPKGLPPSREKEMRSSFSSLRSATLKAAKLQTTVVEKKEGSLVVKREVIGPNKEVIDADEKFRMTQFP